MKKTAYLFLTALFFVFVLSWAGCGSSRKTVNQEDSASQESSQDDFDEIEKLLGISRTDDKSSEQAQKQAQSQQPASQEKQDDLITLLEVDEGKKSETPSATTSQAEDKRIIRLQNQVDELQREVEKKNMEIADLKAQLMMKEESLKKQQAAKPSQSSYTYTQPSVQSSSTSFGDLSEDSYKMRYNEALDLFHQRQYQRAIDEFQDLLATDMNHSVS
ncbi:MAG: hypothetical protein EH225_01300, partial [Calditrichaeota bacterium]